MYPAIAANIQGECRQGCRGDASRCCRRDVFFNFFMCFTRVWGIFTSIVMFGVGVDAAYHRHISGYYLTGASAILLCMETTWVVTLFLQICVRNERSRFLNCWNLVRWFEEWKKSLVYTPLAIVPILYPHGLWLSYAASCQLFALALFHLILSFKSLTCSIRNERLANVEVDSLESSKFEDVLDDGIPEPIPGGSRLHFSDVLPEQDALLEI